jgi:hypothetical protein
MKGMGRRVGFAHGMLNLMGTRLYTASLIARRSRNRQARSCLALTGFYIAAVSGCLGGRLVFGQACDGAQQSA